MKRALAAIVLSLSLASCAATGPIEPPQPGDKVADPRTAMAIAKKLCEVSTLDVWLSPYRWRVERHDGMWHVRVPAFRGRLDRAYADIDIRADDGTAPTRCVFPPPDTVILADVN